MMPKSKERDRRSGTTVNFQNLLKKATAEMLVLHVLRQKPMYTYEIAGTIKRLSQGKLTFNTLYQACYRLSDFGYIRESDKCLSEKNRVRVYFSITESGEQYLNGLMEEYQSFTDAVSLILNERAAPAGHLPGAT